MKSDGILSDEQMRNRIEQIRRSQTTVPTRTITCVLDPKQGYAVVDRQEWNASGQRILHIQSNHFEYHQSANIWLPKQCLIYYYTDPNILLEYSDEPRGIDTVTLQNIDFHPAQDIDYDLSKNSTYRQAGVILVDCSTAEAREKPNHQVVFLIAADGTALRKAAIHS